MKLSEIYAELKAEADATPGRPARRTLERGLGVTLTRQLAHYRLALWRAGVWPSEEEVKTCLRDFGLFPTVTSADRVPSGTDGQWRTYVFLYPLVEVKQEKLL